MDPTPVSSHDEASAILLDVQPQWLLAGTSENPDTIAFGLIAAARTNAVGNAAIIDYGANASFRFRGRTNDALAHAPDWLLVPDEWTAEEFTKLGFPAARVRVVGNPHEEHVAEIATGFSEIDRRSLRRRALPAEASNRTVLLFASELSTGLNEMQFRRSTDYTLTGRGCADGRTEIVIEELMDALRTFDPGRELSAPTSSCAYIPRNLVTVYVNMHMSSIT